MSIFDELLDQIVRDIKPGLEIARKVKKAQVKLGKMDANTILGSPALDADEGVQTEGGVVIPNCSVCNDSKKVGQIGHEVPCPKCVVTK